MDDGSDGQLLTAVRRLIDSPPLRQKLIQGGYATARAHTLERQASHMMTIVRDALAAGRSTAA